MKNGIDVAIEVKGIKSISLEAAFFPSINHQMPHENGGTIYDRPSIYNLENGTLLSSVFLPPVRGTIQGLYCPLTGLP